MSKVNLGTLLIGSSPTVETSSPIVPASNPLKMLFEETLAIIVKPNRASAKYSGALKRNAKVASLGAIAIRTIVLSNPPINEATAEILNALLLAL